MPLQHDVVHRGRSREHDETTSAPQTAMAALALESQMSSVLIIGYYGQPRCAWAGVGDTVFGRYHDEVWRTRTYDESTMFEALALGVFEVGGSWSIVFGKRDAFRTAFRGFDVARSPR